jgi:hypothetical protein
MGLAKAHSGPAGGTILTLLNFKHNEYFELFSNGIWA